MLKVGTRALRSLTRHAVKTTEGVANALGVDQQLESFQRGVESLPLVKPLAILASEVAEGIAPEHKPLYKGESGPHEVGTHRQTFRDEERERDVPLTVYYPKKSGEKSPVVVVSHGLGGNAATYRYLGRHLASHGYTVLQPTHVGSDTKAVVTKTLSSFNQSELKNRKEDISFSLDLLEAGRLPASISDQVDTERVAVAGHSFGALTAQAMAGLTTKDKGGQQLELSDDRVDAFIAMSPYGDSAPTQLLGMDTGSYDQIEQPILYMSGDKDRTFTLGKGPKVHLHPYQETASEDKYHLQIGGARHLDFGQVMGWADPSTAKLTQSTSVAFLDAHLKEQEPAQAYLVDDLPGVAKSWDSVALP